MKLEQKVLIKKGLSPIFNKLKYIILTNTPFSIPKKKQFIIFIKKRFYNTKYLIIKFIFVFFKIEGQWMI